MQSQLNTFTFQGKAVRTVLGEDGEPRWVAKDVAEVLGYARASNPARLFAHVPEDWKGVNPIHTPSGDQEMVVLSEPGLFFFLSRSDKPAALPMQKWVAGEVLPSIRKTGGYQVKPMTTAEALLASAKILVEHEHQIQALQTRVQVIEDRAEEAEQALADLPEPLIHPADLTTRAKVNRMVRDYCHRWGKNHREAWGWLYREFRDRYHFDLVERAKHRGLKPLEMAELLGQLENLYAIAYQIFRNNAA